MSDVTVQDCVSLESLVAEVADDFLDRRRRGERPDVEEYALRYPRFAAVLRQVLSSLELVELASAAGPGRSDLVGVEPPGVLGEFRIVREVGRGGMGVVYEARQLTLDRRVALKVLPFAAALDPKQLRRFKTEAQAAAHLHHTNIVPVFGVGCERGVHFYAMQFIDGRTLAEIVRDRHPAPGGGVPATVPAAGLSSATDRSQPEFFRGIARLGVQAAEALEHAHQEGIIHRDVKPSNLLVDGRGNLWVTDFGLARLRGETGLTVSGDVVGTLRYMSPEQALGATDVVDHRTDVYALGATLYELLTSHPVFGGSDRQELLRQVVFEEPRRLRQLNPAVPVELEVIVLKALDKEARARYATARELADDLRRFLEDRPICARPPSSLDRVRKWARRHRPAVRVATAAALAILMVAAVAVGWICRDAAARRAKIAAELQSALRDVRDFQRSGKWSEAQAAAAVARELLRDGAECLPGAEEAEHVLRELAGEEADRKLLDRLERIRFLQAEVDIKENRFSLEKVFPQYRPAFAAYGWVPEALPAEDAAASLRHRPAAVQGTVAAALDHWLILARYKGAREERWLEQVLAAGDPDAWRGRVRQARELDDLPALKEQACNPAAITQPPEELFLLGMSLQQRGAKGEHLALLRRAREAFPGDFWLNHDLATALEESQPPQFEEASRFLSAAVALRPDNAGVRLNLGIALWKMGRVDEAVAAFRQAIKLRPDYAMAHCQLAILLAVWEWPDEALVEAARALELQPDLARAYYAIGEARVCRCRYIEAEAAFRRAIELEPDHAEAYCQLGDVLRRQGRFAAALASYERGHKLGSRRPNWVFPSARWVQETRRLCELEPGLPDVLRGTLRPADAERETYAGLCQFKRYFAAAARLRFDAMAADPRAPGRGNFERTYSAACAAAQAGCGQGEDAGRLRAEERTRWRKQALEWLRVNLDEYAKFLDGTNLLDRRIAQRNLRHWQSDVTLDGLRGPSALAALPADEARAWRQFWADVASALARPEPREE